MEARRGPGPTVAALWEGILYASEYEGTISKQYITTGKWTFISRYPLIIIVFIVNLTVTASSNEPALLQFDVLIFPRARQGKIRWGIPTNLLVAK
jgi:hypothetical protein